MKNKILLFFKFIVKWIIKSIARIMLLLSVIFTIFFGYGIFKSSTAGLIIHMNFTPTWWMTAFLAYIFIWWLRKKENLSLFPPYSKKIFKPVLLKCVDYLLSTLEVIIFVIVGLSWGIEYPSILSNIYIFVFGFLLFLMLGNLKQKLNSKK